MVIFTPPDCQNPKTALFSIIGNAIFSFEYEKTGKPNHEQAAAETGKPFDRSCAIFPGTDLRG